MSHWDGHTESEFWTTEFKLVGSPCPAPPGMKATYLQPKPDEHGRYLCTQKVVCLHRAIPVTTTRDRKTRRNTSVEKLDSAIFGYVAGELGLENPEELSNFYGYAADDEELAMMNKSAREEAMAKREREEKPERPTGE